MKGAVLGQCSITARFAEPMEPTDNVTRNGRYSGFNIVPFESVNYRLVLLHVFVEVGDASVKHN